MRPEASWFADAILYEIYPQSFADGNGDGIGDFAGVLEHLDHLAWLGVNTIWFNPCFASPFRDAGYDVSDYLQIAPRYGTNDDLVRIVDAGRARGMRVLLDLVAGHTSVEHGWFRAALTDPGDERFIWSDRPGPRFVASPGPRAGYYLKNFYDEQPALNFGYARPDPAQPWRKAPDAPGPQANRAALREIIGFWLDRGVAGFRVDMATSLIKDDPDMAETAKLWRELTDWLHEAYPSAVLLPESGFPMPEDFGVRGGFDGDFLLPIHEAHSALFNNGGAGVLPWLVDYRGCFFDAAGPDGPGTFGTFARLWAAHRAATSADRPVILASADHDFARLACGTRTAEQLGAAFAFLLTWGTVPAVYYGDEIGMRYLPGLPDHEGSVCNPNYNRAGCRTPMQWDDRAPNAGFSTAPAERLYLPQDPDPGRPTVSAQREDPASVLHTVRELIALRKQERALGVGAPTTVLHGDYPLVYLRGDRHLVVVNPLGAAARAPIDLAGRDVRVLAGTGVEVRDGQVRAERFGYGVFQLS
ncbi:MAG TPA: alpha-amylase family glycosyl hydrolase [Jatrophihabitans sp.]|nr:alpha-amylase family glycosyl hydrolase [Jatrophihabitans sp.]